ncbi:hypothetical protein PWT90_06274 [Aphanocladium album]|nr:hypothetical protein PWT90_06274 [Aphanocladium album]
MASSASDECCITDALKEPVQIFSIGATPNPQQPSTALERFFDNASLDKYLSSSVGQNYSCRFIWAMARCDFSSFMVVYYTYEFPEILYTIRYPEFKDSENEWSIRQTGICHRINIETRQTILLLLSPKPNSKSHQAIHDYLTATTSHYAGNTWFAVHDVLLKAHLPAWRAFNKSCEAEFLPISNATFATYIDEPLRVGYDQLSILSSLQARFLKIISLVSSTTELLDELLNFLQNFPDVVNEHRRQNTIVNNLNNHRRSCMSYQRSANFLRDRVQAASQLLANTLSYRDQVIANEQNGNMLQLNKSAVFITTLTLIYAPASFVATFFGMNFFAMDQPNSQIVCTAMIWIYIVTTFAFTIVTVIFYYWLLRHDGVLFGRLAPKVPDNADWKGFVRRLTRLDNSVEMQPYHH